MSKEIRETITFEINNILKIFEKNIFKGFIISELKKDHIKNFTDEKTKIDFENLCQLESVENIARSQSLVILVTSFETFLKDFFKIILSNRPDFLKKSLRKIDEKWTSLELVEVLNGDLLVNKIIEKARLNFQNFGSLEKAFNLIDISFHDEIYEAQRRTIEHIALKYPNNPIDFKGVELLTETFSNRHQIVHEGLSFDTSDFELNVRMIFFQYLVTGLIEKFSDSDLTLYERTFNLE